MNNQHRNEKSQAATASNHISFQRPPRVFLEMPDGEMTIPPPAQLPEPPVLNLLSAMLPAGFALLTLIPSVLLDNALAAVASLGFLVIMPMMEVLRYREESRRYKQRMAERESAYRAMLETRTLELTELHTKQKIALQQCHPEIAECIERARVRDRQLWSRDITHFDWLSLRMGLGSVPFGMTVKPPDYDPLLGFDPLLQSAHDMAQSANAIPHAPICLPLREMNAAGLVGSRDEALNLARAIAIQISAHHPPDEVKIAALFPAHEARHWDWLRALPHAWDDEHNACYLADDPRGAAQLVNELYALINRRAMQAAEDGNRGEGEEAAPPLPYYVVFLADPSLYENAPALFLMLTQGSKLGTALVLLADRLESLPRECGAVVECEAGGGRFRRAGASPAVPSIPFAPDPAPVGAAEQIARSLEPIQLKRTAAPIPRVVPLLDLLGLGKTDELDALDAPARWHAHDGRPSLAAPIGKRLGNEVLTLDMHETGDGPHGLLAGTTGAGKSELLQSLITSLAVNYHPHRVAFLLVDYKGGGMADVFGELPHLAGIVTDLEGTLANRALVAIRSELHRREEHFRALKVTHVDDYHALRTAGVAEATGHPPLPHLIIIVDEFAELVKQQPDFMSELISTARRGRSLGVHLLLATQQPAGVVNDQIWSNSRFRLCLRVERDEDSRDILKRPDAAALPKSQPGQAYLQVGSGEVFERFQAGWAGAPLPESLIESSDSGRATTQVQAVVRYLRRAADACAVPPVPKPWLDPLPQALTLDSVRETQGWDGRSWRPVDAWMAPVVGRNDDPAGPSQEPLQLNLGREGHLLVCGMPASGKTTFVQTLITSLVRTHSPEDLHLYVLDFGSRLLSIFKALPHVGGVIFGDEDEKVMRIFRHLQGELEQRKATLAEAGVANLMDYRRMGKRDLPAIVLIVDNYPSFATAYEDQDDMLAQLAREGSGYGVHIVLTVDGPNSIRPRLSSNMALAVTMQLKDPGDYMSIVGRTNGLMPSPFPGRGLVRGEPPLEFQTALPAAGQTEYQRTNSLKAVFEAMARAWGDQPKPRPITTLPEVQPLCELLGDEANINLPKGIRDERINGKSNPREGEGMAVPIGLNEDSLDPFYADLDRGPHFMITGAVQSGKTTLLRSWLIALAHRFSLEHVQLHLVDFRQDALQPLAALPHVRYADGPESFDALVHELHAALSERKEVLAEARRRLGSEFALQAAVSRFPRLVLAVDNFDALRDQASMDAMITLDALARESRGLGLHVLLAAAEGDLFGVDGWAKTVKDQQTGFYLGSVDMQVFNVRVPMGMARKTFAPGQGFYISRARLTGFKAATTDEGEVRLPQLVRNVRERWPVEAAGVNGIVQSSHVMR